jgi:hypothetical protein
MAANTSRSERHEPLQTLAALLLVSVLAGCSASGAASGTPARGSPNGSAIATAATGVTPSASAASPSPTTASIGSVNATADRAGDASPGYLDISQLRIGAASGQLTLGLDLAAAVPTGSPSVGLLAYTFSIDVDGDGAWDYRATLSLVPEGGFRPSLANRRTGQTLEGSAYPGTANMAGQSITLTVPLATLGCPPVVHVRAASERTQGGTTSGDTAPDASADWVLVSTGC